MKMTKLKHQFVEFIPREIENGMLYISMEYATAVHKCCCGCGSKVVTPFTSTDWYIIFDGESVSLYPSVGSWSLPCQSHYFIRGGKVVWARGMSKKKIEAIRKQDELLKKYYYSPSQLTDKERNLIKKMWHLA